MLFIFGQQCVSLQKYRFSVWQRRWLSILNIISTEKATTQEAGDWWCRVLMSKRTISNFIFTAFRDFFWQVYISIFLFLKHSLFWWLVLQKCVLWYEWEKNVVQVSNLFSSILCSCSLAWTPHFTMINPPLARPNAPSSPLHIRHIWIDSNI